MKKWLVLALAVTFFCMLFGESVSDSTWGKPRKSYNIWLFGEVGVGIIKSVSLLSLDGGLGLEYNERIRVTVYKIRYAEKVKFFDSAKYEFRGQGGQIGYVWRKNNLKVIPSLGYEYGTIGIGEGPLLDGFLGNDYESYRFVDIGYILVSVNAQLKIAPASAISSRLFFSYNKDYPVFGVSMCLCLGKM